MAIGRLVPWSSWGEWGGVYRGFFAASTQQKKAALYQVPSAPYWTSMCIKAYALRVALTHMHHTHMLIVFRVHAVGGLAAPRQGPTGYRDHRLLGRHQYQVSIWMLAL